MEFASDLEITRFDSEDQSVLIRLQGFSEQTNLLEGVAHACRGPGGGALIDTAPGRVRQTILRDRRLCGGCVVTGTKCLSFGKQLFGRRRKPTSTRPDHCEHAERKTDGKPHQRYSRRASASGSIEIGRGRSYGVPSGLHLT